MGYLGAMPRRCMARNHEHRNVMYRQYVCIICSGYESGLDLRQCFRAIHEHGE